MPDESGFYVVTLKAFPFDTKDEAMEFHAALCQAFATMPEAYQKNCFIHLDFVKNTVKREVMQ